MILQYAYARGRQFLLPISIFLIGALATTQLRSFSEGFLFLLASVGQFAVFVFVSRLRQRGSFFWHVIAALSANGAWYALMHVLKIADAYWLLVIPYLCGIIAGRTTGVILAQFVEEKYSLTADATRDSNIAPGRRVQYLKREPMFWALVTGLLGCVAYGHIAFEPSMLSALYIVVLFGVLQNFFYAANARASQRGSDWYIAITGVAAGLMFVLSATFLLSMNMPLLLAIPYILSTSLGSALGAFLSMIIEWRMKLRPDAHLEARPAGVEEEKEQHQDSGASPHKLWRLLRVKAPYALLFFVGATWIIVQEPLFRFLGWPVVELQFPIASLRFDLPRVLVMLAAAVVFALDSALHVVASRAGNRNHQGYHVISLIPKGVVDFLRISYLTMNSYLLDIVPIAVAAACLGSLFGKNIGEYFERRLMAVMDIHDDEE